MKNIFILFIVLLLFTGGCDHTTVGYLETINAVYVPDTAVWKAVLNPEKPEEARQLELGIPFSTTEIQGVQGTNPVTYCISRVDTDNGIPANVTGQFYIAGSRIQLPAVHTVPVGRYIFTLEVRNEGHSQQLDSVFTVMIK